MLFFEILSLDQMLNFSSNTQDLMPFLDALKLKYVYLFISRKVKGQGQGQQKGQNHIWVNNSCYNQLRTFKLTPILSLYPGPSSSHGNDVVMHAKVQQNHVTK